MTEFLTTEELPPTQKEIDWKKAEDKVDFLLVEEGKWYPLHTGNLYGKMITVAKEKGYYLEYTTRSDHVNYYRVVKIEKIPLGTRIKKWFYGS